MSARSFKPTSLFLVLGSLPAVMYALERYGSAVWGGPRFTGQLFGVAASSLLALAAILSFRHPRMERFMRGLDNQYRLHHLAGTFAIALAVGHVAMLAISSYARSPKAAAYLFRFDRLPPALLLGWLSLAILSIVAISASALDRGSRLWRPLHLLSLPACLFALYHFHALGPSSGIWRPLLYFSTILGLGAGLLRSFKYVFAHRYRVRHVERLGEDTVAIALEAEGAPIRCERGKYIFAAFHSGCGYVGCDELHPFNITSSSDDRSLEIIVKNRGDCSCTLQHVVPGVLAHIEGPYGGIRPDPGPQLWIGGGIGIASFLALLEGREDSHRSIDVYYLARRKEEHVLAGRLREAAKDKPWVTLHLITIQDDSSKLMACMREGTPDFESRSFILCGPPSMVGAVEHGLASLGIPPSRIQHESFGLL